MSRNKKPPCHQRLRRLYAPFVQRHLALSRDLAAYLGAAGRIDEALASGGDWILLETRSRDVAASERPLAERLAALPASKD